MIAEAETGAKKCGWGTWTDCGDPGPPLVCVYLAGVGIESDSLGIQGFYSCSLRELGWDEAR